MVFNSSHAFFLLFDYWRYEKFEETKGVIRIRKLKNRQYNCQKEKGCIMIFTDWGTWTQLETGGELRCSGRVGSSCSNSNTSHVTLITWVYVNFMKGSLTRNGHSEKFEDTNRVVRIKKSKDLKHNGQKI
jgi:hypothetical protein